MEMRGWKTTGVLLIVMLIATSVSANIDNLSNMSAEWIRTGNRNAATDAADIVLYNPAALPVLSEGWHLNIGNQTLIRKPEHSYNDGTGQKTYKQDSPDLFLPNLYGAYNKDAWSIYAGFYIPGGGAVVDYPNGSITTQLAGMGVLASPADPALSGFGINTIGDIYGSITDESLEATSNYLTTTIGGAYRINKTVSVSAGIRYINARNSVKAQLTLADLSATAQAVNAVAPGTLAESTTLKIDEKATADGCGGIIGVHADLTDKLNLGLTYQSEVKLDFETKVNRDDLGMFTNGEKNRRDFPAFLGLGLGYDISDKLYGEFNTSYWFQKDANWGTDASGRDISDMAGDAWSFGASLAYKVTPELLVSAGTTFTKFNWGDIHGYYSANLGSLEVLYSDNWHIGAGCAWEFKKDMKLNFGIGQTIWEDETIYYDTGAAVIPVSTSNATTTIALGCDLAF